MSHIANAIAISTAAFKIVIVTIYAECHFDLLGDFHYLALALEARQYLNKSVKEDVSSQE